MCVLLIMTVILLSVVIKNPYQNQLRFLVVYIGDVYSNLGVSKVGGCVCVLRLHRCKHLRLPLVVEICFHFYASSVRVNS